MIEKKEVNFPYLRSFVGESADHQKCGPCETQDRVMCPESEGVLYTFADSQARHLPTVLMKGMKCSAKNQSKKQKVTKP